VPEALAGQAIEQCRCCQLLLTQGVHHIIRTAELYGGVFAPNTHNGWVEQLLLTTRALFWALVRHLASTV
jgi:hypothetical protein